jgi:hypothetical protein
VQRAACEDNVLVGRAPNELRQSGPPLLDEGLVSLIVHLVARKRVHNTSQSARIKALSGPRHGRRVARWPLLGDGRHSLEHGP